jgi:hypothetical protein
VAATTLGEGAWLAQRWRRPPLRWLAATSEPKGGLRPPQMHPKGGVGVAATIRHPLYFSFFFFFYFYKIYIYIYIYIIKLLFESIFVFKQNLTSKNRIFCSI